MIVKIQKPIVSSVSEPKFLIYNESRTFIREEHGHDKLFTGGEIKVYHKAQLKNDQLIIKQRVKDQLW